MKPLTFWTAQGSRVGAVIEPQGESLVVDLHDADPGDFLQAVREGAHLFQGVTDSTMSHGEGWQFIQVGRAIERASATATLLDVYTQEFCQDAEDRTPEGSEHLEWIVLLRSCTAFEAYSKVQPADLGPEPIIEFLLLNGKFPHSIRFAVDAMENALNAIRGEGGERRALP